LIMGEELKVSGHLTHPRRLDQIVIRFAGDSGDGMQVAGDRFTNASAVLGNDLATFPDYPAEIRAPAGTLPGVSAFQVQVADHDVLTPGDRPDILVAMNPAALKAELGDLVQGASILVNTDAFDERSLAKAGFSSNPLEDGTLKGYKVYEVPMTSLTLEACKPTGAKPRDAERSKNFFALGLVCWVYGRPVEPVLAWIDKRFGDRPQVHDANQLAFKAGYNFGETAELFETPFEIPPAHLAAGRYANVTGNTALAWGLIAAANQAGMQLFLGSYPITPASDVLHELAKHKRLGVLTFQAEDEIAGAGSALGASWGGALGVTTTSGPGLDLQAETIGLGVMLEVPFLVVDIQRAGPSTGMPTKPEQSDLLEAFFGRHGETPVPVLAAKTPSHCFDAAIEAARIALTYRTPVILLSDAYLANGAEPWLLPEPSSLPDLRQHPAQESDGEFQPYARDPDTLAPNWALPGTPGLEYRIGGLEKQDVTGNVSYDPLNHEEMTQLRVSKIQRIASSIPPLELEGDEDAEALVLGWGSTYGAIYSALRRLRREGHRLAQAHLVHLNPFPANLGEVLSRYKTVIVPELNLGQLARLLRASFLKDIKSITKVQGRPFLVDELVHAISEHLEEK
jgi:2-oxoglutarate ferredoxin oxidoreductase subunit alpha